MSKLKNKVVLVTGAGTGIGKATAIKCAEEGARLVLGNRNEKRGQELVELLKSKGAEALFLKTDVTNGNELKALIDAAVNTYGRLDIAFNNAGVEGVSNPITDSTEEDYDKVMDTNVKSVWNAIRLQIPAMLVNGGGSIINNASIAGLIGFPGQAIYSASKHAVIGLTKAAALEFSAQGVRVNAVAPAAIETPMLERFTGDEEGGPAKEQMVAMHPIGRLGKPEEIANVVAFLGSDEASFVTGQTYAVDGAFTSI